MSEPHPTYGAFKCDACKNQFVEVDKKGVFLHCESNLCLCNQCAVRVKYLILNVWVDGKIKDNVLTIGDDNHGHKAGTDKPG